jgi:hypothetical protein
VIPNWQLGRYRYLAQHLVPSNGNLLTKGNLLCRAEVPKARLLVRYVTCVLGRYQDAFALVLEGRLTAVDTLVTDRTGHAIPPAYD